MIIMNGDFMGPWMLLTVKESNCFAYSLSQEPLLAFSPFYPCVAPWSKRST